MMERLIDKHLAKWKSSRHRTPLILAGARQVGKTYSLRRFGQDHFDATVILDLERNPDWHRLFEGNLEARRICADLEILSKHKIIPGKTLLFLDEIQACPRAITALQCFLEEIPELHVAAAGSLLPFAMRDISLPMGRIQLLHLYPLCFSEYLRAIGNDRAAEVVLAPPRDTSEAVHHLLCEELRRYFFVGGMPESVNAYAETGSIRESFEVQAKICETYRMDFAKYSPQVDKHCLNAVLTAIAQSVGHQIKYTRLTRDFSSPTIKKAFHLLCQASVVRKVASADPSGPPLGSTASKKVFKAIVIDVGLMRHLSGMPTDVEYGKADLLGIYQGATAEQFVGQEMVSSLGEDLYYWSRSARSSTAEVDYLTVIDGRITPIEVKSGASGRLKSLHLFLKTYTDSPWGMVLSTRPYKELSDRSIKLIPLYFAFSACRGFEDY